MRSLWTRLTVWWRRAAAVEWWGGDPSAPIFPPHILAQIDATVERLEVTFTRRTVAQIQAELRAAAAEDRLADYTDAWLQGSVEELSEALLQERREQRRAAGPDPSGSSSTQAHRER